MATFYVAPSRQLLRQRCGEAVAAIFPGATCGSADWPDFGEALAALIEERADAVVVYREDFDETRRLQEMLIGSFGAEPDDAIIEIDLGSLNNRKAA